MLGSITRNTDEVTATTVVNYSVLRGCEGIAVP